MDSADGSSPTGPGALPGSASKRGVLLFTLDVDGEVSTSAVTTAAPPTTGSAGGFGSSGGPSMTEEDHRASTRSFPSMIDPAAGRIAED